MPALGKLMVDCDWLKRAEGLRVEEVPGVQVEVEPED
jgi:hypothetical protein